MHQQTGKLFHRAGRISGAILSLALLSAQPVALVAGPTAERPPMGWNSWDAFGCTLNEQQAKAEADAQARLLLAAGWNYFVVDIQWYDPTATGHLYNPKAIFAMDAYGRLLPAPERFPSAANGAGFKPLADYVHARGLAFGIHLMRGIARQAVRANTPIFGSSAHARDIALTNSLCCWNPNMYGVDATLPEGQAYYDSLIALYASWGVDFLKVDDMSRPYDAVQTREIEAIRRAIDRCGRPMVLSLSPGDTPLSQGAHVAAHANQWRVSDDFWDQWKPLYGMFKRLDAWTPFRGPGHWPDADMLPLGRVEFGRETRFTTNEQVVCMTLWSIARSPLILGADMTRLDTWTLSLLTNRAVLAVNQASTHNRQLSRKKDLVVWAAEVPDSPDRFLAFFNLNSTGAAAELSADWAALGCAGPVEVHDLWSGRSLGYATNRFARALLPHAAALYRLVPIGDKKKSDRSIHPST